MVSPFKKRPVWQQQNQVGDDVESKDINSEPKDESDDDGYAQFLMSLVDTNSIGNTSGKHSSRLIKEDEDIEDEEEYISEEDDEDVEENEGLDEDDDDDEDQLLPQTSSLIETKSDINDSLIRSEDEYDDEDSWDLDPQELEDELGDLLQEDMEAAILALLQHSSKENTATNKEDTSNTLIQIPTKSGQHVPSSPPRATTVIPDASKNNVAPSTRSMNPPIHSSQGSSLPTRKVLPTQRQFNRLHKLMNKQYQLLVQQTVLAIRAAQTQKVNKEKKMNDNQASGSLTPHLKVPSLVPPSLPTLSLKKLPLSMQNPVGAHSQTKSLLPPSSTSSVPSFLGHANIPPTQRGLKSQSPSASYPEFFLSGESADEIAEVLDTAVGMLQDLEKNRKDALRYALQMKRMPNATINHTRFPILVSHSGQNETMRQSTNCKVPITCAYESIIPSIHASSYLQYSLSKQVGQSAPYSNSQERSILTRAAFSKALQTGNDIPPSVSLSDPRSTLSNQFCSNSNISCIWHTYPITTFDVKGLDRLYDSFAMIDNSVIQASSGWDTRMLVGQKDFMNVLNPSDHGDACEILLQHAHADFDRTLLPGRRDLLSLFSNPSEIWSNFFDKLGQKEESILRKSRVFFTSGEDNLLLRGVNLYGEKEWSIISNRYMPERGINLISQRHSKLSVTLYEALGIHIGEEGDLDRPAVLKHEDLDESSIAHINPVVAPFCMNVHRWSLEEDMAILKAVPIVGHYWADISSLLIPHRERGHLRKRYQVLERRVKATVKRVGKIPPLCDRSKGVASESVNKAKRKLTKTIDESQSNSSKKSKNKESATSAKEEDAMKPSHTTTRQGGHNGTSMLAPKHSLYYAKQHVRPTIPGSFHMNKMTPNYVPHGFTAPPLYPLLKHAPFNPFPSSISAAKSKVPPLPYDKYSLSTKFASGNVSTYANYTSRAPIMTQTTTAPCAKIEQSTDLHLCGDEMNKQAMGSVRPLEQKNPLSQGCQVGVLGLSVSPSASSFHFSPSSIKLSQIESTNSPSWLMAHDAGVSCSPNGNTITSLERLMHVEGLSQMFTETNDSAVMNQNLTIKSSKSNEKGIFSSQIHSMADAQNDTAWNDNTNGPNLDTLDDSCTGLSLLKDIVSPESKKICRSSILSSVLAYSNKGNHEEVNSNDSRVSSTSRALGSVGTFKGTSMTNKRGGLSLDGIEPSNMSFYEGSRLHQFDDIGDFTLLDDQGNPVCNSLLPPEFDAVAVLNQMSCSNMTTLANESSKQRIHSTEAHESTFISDDIKIQNKGSLFAKVVGGVVRDNKTRLTR